MSLLSTGIAVIATALAAYLLTRYFSRNFNHMRITGIDVHKADKPLRPEMGGAAVLAAVPIGSGIILFSQGGLSLQFISGLGTIVLTGTVGLLDDLHGMKQRYKTLLVAGASFPVALLLLNRTTINFPLVGQIPFGILYPLLVVPLAVTTSANFCNILAGFNGLEIGTGAIAIGTISLLAAVKGSGDVAILGAILLVAFLAFLKLNWYPAKIFPGDTGTLMSGSAIATLGLISGAEFSAIVLTMPAALDFTLKAVSKKPFSQRKRFGDASVNSEGKLEPAGYPALVHAFMKASPMNEKDLVVSVLLMEAIYATLAFLITITLL